MARTAQAVASTEERRAARAAEKRHGDKSRAKMAKQKLAQKQKQKAKLAGSAKRKSGTPQKRVVAAGNVKTEGEAELSGLPEAAVGRKPPKWKWSTTAKREIKKEMRSSINKRAIPRARFRKMVRQMVPGYRVSKNALSALMEACEAHVVEALESARYIADGEQVPTVKRRHLQLVAMVRGKMTTPTPLPREIEEAMSRPIEAVAVAPVGVVRRAAPPAPPPVQPDVDLIEADDDAADTEEFQADDGDDDDANDAATAMDETETE